MERPVPTYAVILRDKIGTPKESRTVILEGETSLNKVRGVARKIKSRMDRKVVLVRNGKELPVSALDKEALDAWLETNQPEETR